MQEHPLQDQRKVLEDEATQLELELLNMKSTYRSLHAMVGDNNTGETSDASAESEGESTREKEREPGGSPQPSGEMEDGGSDGDEFPVEVSYYGILYDTATPPETSLLQRNDIVASLWDAGPYEYVYPKSVAISETYQLAIKNSVTVELSAISCFVPLEPLPLGPFLHGPRKPSVAMFVSRSLRPANLLPMVDRPAKLPDLGSATAVEGGSDGGKPPSLASLSSSFPFAKTPVMLALNRTTQRPRELSLDPVRNSKQKNKPGATIFPGRILMVTVQLGFGSFATVALDSTAKAGELLQSCHELLGLPPACLGIVHLLSRHASILHRGVHAKKLAVHETLWNDSPGNNALIAPLIEVAKPFRRSGTHVVQEAVHLVVECMFMTMDPLRHHLPWSKKIRNRGRVGRTIDARCSYTLCRAAAPLAHVQLEMDEIGESSATSDADDDDTTSQSQSQSQSQPTTRMSRSRSDAGEQKEKIELNLDDLENKAKRATHKKRRRW